MKIILLIASLITLKATSNYAYSESLFMEGVKFILKV